MLPSVQGSRSSMDPAFARAVSGRELLKTLDVPVCQLEGWEGDDI